MEPPRSPRSRQGSTEQGDRGDRGSTPASLAEAAASRGQADQNQMVAQAALGATGVEHPSNSAPQFESITPAQRALAYQINEGNLRLASLSAANNYLFRPGGNIQMDEMASALLRARMDPLTSLLSLGPPPSASIPRVQYPPSRMTNLTDLESIASELAARSMQHPHLNQPFLSLSNPAHYLAGVGPAAGAVPNSSRFLAQNPQRFDQTTFNLPSALFNTTGIVQDRHMHSAVEQQPMSGVARSSSLDFLGGQAFPALSPATVSLPTSALRRIPQPNEAAASLNLSRLYPTGSFPSYSQAAFSLQIPQHNETATSLNLSRLYPTNATTTTTTSTQLANFAQMPEAARMMPEETKEQQQRSESKDVDVDEGHDDDDDDDDGRKPSASKDDDCAPQNQQSSSAAAANLMGVSFPSERSSLNLREGSNSPREAHRILKILGSTLRSKTDPFVDVAALPEPHGPGMKRMIRGSDRFFPDELHSMLLEVEKEGLYTEAVSFLPHGRAFRVHKKDVFIKEVLPRYFGGKGKWTSFLRQLKLYGFLRVSEGKDCDAYYHELFLKTRPELIQYMRRVGTPKGLDRRTFRPAEGEDPDFYSLPPLMENETEEP